MNRLLYISLTVVLASTFTVAAEQTYRMCDGITAFVVNKVGREFNITLDVRDINIYESGPREVLVKVYDPDGKTVVREVIPDDGVTKAAYSQPAGAWDHEAWYYAYCRMQGTAPMVRWSAFSEPDRLATLAKRTFNYKVAGGKPGIYRLHLVGATDHYVTTKIDPDLPYGVSGHATFLQGHGDMFRKSFIYVPQGSKGLHVVAGEWDQPGTRKFKLTAADGKVLFDGDTSRGFIRSKIDFDSASQYDDQILVLDVSEGAGDFLLEIKHRFDKNPEVAQRGEPAISAVLAPDVATAKAIRGGAIYHDDRVFWHGYQVRLHDWLKALKPSDFVVKDEAGKEIDVKQLPRREGFIRLNSSYWRPPLCDTEMYHWLGHKNRAALNIAIRDLTAGLRSIGPNDHVAVAVGGPFANMGYEFSNYAWHYWRPGWRILQQSDAPDEVKELLREAFLVAGDRLAFCRSWARVNGNSFALIPSALRYCSTATDDPLQKELFETYFDRFANGGWGDRVGVGPSGPVQEGFAYAYHYGSYPVRTWQSVLADFPDDKRFRPVYNRMRTWYSYTLAEEKVAAGAWSARTHFYPHWSIEREGPFIWKGLPGPDFTVSINDANEWFAARRKNYYAVTYHGRLSPKWNSNANAGQCGFGGGMICQLHIPDHGPVLASTLNGDYGRGMDLSLWPTFHIHSLVGTMAGGQPLVSADSEHLDAKLAGNTTTGSGDIRSASAHVTRSNTFDKDTIICKLNLRGSNELDLLNLWTNNPFHGKVKEAWEMIPFVPNKKGKPKGPTSITLFDVQGRAIGKLTNEPVAAKSIKIDRGGFGVRVELDQLRRVHRGENNTLLIELVNEITPAEDVSLEYRLVPFVSESK